MLDFEINNNVAHLTLNDGKANVFGAEMMSSFNQALDQAENGADALVISGEGKMFSAGYDLSIMTQDAEQRMPLVLSGFEMLLRLYQFPMPVISVVNGHALGLGAFLCLVSDTSIAQEGSYKIGLPETAGNMEFTHFLVSLIQAHLNPCFINRTALQSQPCNPKSAVEAGFIDLVVAQDQIQATLGKVTEGLLQLPKEQYAENKLQLRNSTITQLEQQLSTLKG